MFAITFSIAFRDIFFLLVPFLSIFDHQLQELVFFLVLFSEEEQCVVEIRREEYLEMIELALIALKFKKNPN